MSHVVKLYHGSQFVVDKPDFNFNNKNNDYGKGLYCTQDLELAKEWACQKNTNFFF